MMTPGEAAGAVLALYFGIWTTLGGAVVFVAGLPTWDALIGVGIVVLGVSMFCGGMWLMDNGTGP